MKRRTGVFITALLVSISLAGCGKKETAASYQTISPEDAKAMMEEEEVTILDVRTAEEYAEAHIGDAINIPNEEIGTNEIKELPDKDETILVYCRSGRRSAQAAQKLAALGYTGVYDFGGIIDWPYETVK